MNLYPRRSYSPIGAVALLVAAYGLIKLAGTGILEVGLAGMLVALAGYLVADWSISKRSEERAREYEAAAEDLHIIQELRQYTPEQLEQIRELRIIRMRLLPAYGEAKLLWNLQDSMSAPSTLYSSEEVRDVWNACSPSQFVPVSTWDDGTRKRAIANVLLTRWVGAGLLVRPTGNRPAQWTSDDAYDKAFKDLVGQW